MDQQREKASAIAHEFVVYQESEQSDIKAEEYSMPFGKVYMMYVNS